VELRPADQESVALLAVYLVQAGRPREAVDLLEPYAGASPPDLDVLTARGMGLAALGRLDEILGAVSGEGGGEDELASVVPALKRDAGGIGGQGLHVGWFRQGDVVGCCRSTLCQIGRCERQSCADQDCKGDQVLLADASRRHEFHSF
jgi:hypothetical protein